MNHLRVNNPYPRRVPWLHRWRPFGISVGISLGTIVGSAVAYFLYWSTHAPARPAQRERSVQPGYNEDPVARARRLVALEAMERGDYELAHEQLTLAVELPEPPADLLALLAVTENLLQKKRQARPPSRPATNPVPVRSPRAASIQPLPSPKEPEPAFIQVRTIPSSLVIKVDGSVRDLSPARIEVEPGRHVVAVVRDDERLLRRNVVLKPGKVAYINADLTEKLRPPPPAKPPPASKPVPAKSRFSRPASVSKVPSLEAMAARQLPVQRLPVPDEAVLSRRLADRSTIDRTPAVLRRRPNDSLDRAPNRELDDKVERRYPEPRALAPSRPLPTPLPTPRPKSGPSPEPETGTIERPVPLPKAPKPKRRAKPSGRIPAAAVREVIERQGRRISSCYNAQLRNHLGVVAGKVVIKLLVAPDGSVIDGRIHRSTLNSSMVGRCIQKGIRELKFPAPRGGAAEVTFAMRFGR